MANLMQWLTLGYPKRRLNKGQGHSFYQSIPHMRLPVIVTFRTHRLATIHNVTDDRRNKPD